MKKNSGVIKLFEVMRKNHSSKYILQTIFIRVLKVSVHFWISANEMAETRQLDFFDDALRKMVYLITGN